MTKNIILTITICIFLSGCTNTMQGQMHNPKSKKTEIVSFNF